MRLIKLSTSNFHLLPFPTHLHFDFILHQKIFSPSCLLWGFFDKQRSNTWQWTVWLQDCTTVCTAPKIIIWNDKQHTIEKVADKICFHPTSNVSSSALFLSFVEVVFVDNVDAHDFIVGVVEGFCILTRNCKLIAPFSFITCHFFVLIIDYSSIQSTNSNDALCSYTHTHILL